jgi:ABC-2 type transport system permease protein
VVVVALFCGDAVASEASWGSLRYLLAVPVPRARLLGIKLLVALLYSARGDAAAGGTALLAGTLRYGWNPLRAPVGGTLSPGDGWSGCSPCWATSPRRSLVVGALAFLLSVSTDAPLGAVGGAVLLYIVSNILDQITALGSIRAFLPTHYNEAWLGLLSDTHPDRRTWCAAWCSSVRLLHGSAGAGLVALPPQGRGELTSAGRIASAHGQAACARLR